jgi:hypothetical protein
MKERIYFEYLCTGGLPRNGVPPVPEYSKGALTLPYQRAKQASELFKKIITHYRIKILKVGYVLTSHDKTGITDILALWDNVKVIIDLKYSGLLDDKWNVLGWETENLPNKDRLMIQGVHYKLLAREVLGIENIPFYYWVFNSKDPTDMKIIKQTVDEDRFALHQMNVDKMSQSIEKEMKRGFKAKPDYRLCMKCQIFDKCKVRAEVPIPVEVFY